VQRRIWKAYRRHAEVIYPPVSVEKFYSADSEGYYLIVSELVSYKRIDYVVRYCARNKKALKIVGKGPEYSRLKLLSAPCIEFCGRVPDDDLRDLYARCRAVIIPGEEDFGLVAVEALASGKPVIALGRGGVLESVPEYAPRAGFFFTEPNESSLQKGMDAFEREEGKLSSDAMQFHAASFSEEHFRRAMSKVLFGNHNMVAQHRTSHSLVRREQLEPADFTNP
jgi:glycosyltransferase involved in cell wall biosynthesis